MAVGAALAGSGAREAFDRANALFLERKLPQAAAAVDQAIRLDPHFVAAILLKAKMAVAVHDYAVARQCLEAALKEDPRSQQAQFVYGLIAYFENSLTDALPRLKKARELNPQDPRAALYLGLTVESLGQPEQALKLYEEAVRLENAVGAPQAETLLPGARLLLVMGRLEDCGKWLGKALKLAPKSRDAHFELARLLLKQGDAAKAAAEGELALTLADGVATDASIHYVLIRAWQQAGSPEKAEMHAAIMRAEEK